MDSSSKAKLKYFYSKFCAFFFSIKFCLNKEIFLANMTHSITPPAMKPSYQHFCESCECECDDAKKKSKRIDTNQVMIAASDRLKQNNFVKMLKNVKNKIHST